MEVSHSYQHIISLENLLEAWQEFVVGKRSRKDVQQFEKNLMGNILALHRDLAEGKYRHSAYEPFQISDPKPRNIHKAEVRDRLLHKAIYRVIYPEFDLSFIADSYSCREGKGTHKAFLRLQQITRKVSKNFTQPCWGLKADVRRFFDSVDHQVLIGLLEKRIKDEQLLNLLKQIIQSFETKPGKGMPLGNLTSQLFANVYLHPLDIFVKHRLKAKHYLRYADDFIFLGSNPDELGSFLVEASGFLKQELGLVVHPDKTILRKLKGGIDFVGYVALPHYSLPRKKTARRAVVNLKRSLAEGNPALENQYQSYLGYFSHAKSRKLQAMLGELTGLSLSKIG